LSEVNIEESDLEHPIKIELLSKKYNYFIVNNKINTSFLTYFLKKYHDFNLTSNRYNIKIIDENIQLKTVNSLDFEEILLNKNNFEIGTLSQPKNIFQSLDGKKLSDSITFSISSDYNDLHDLITVEHVLEEDYSDLPDLISEEQVLEEDYVDIDNFN
jgi:hypothetical protein